MKWRINGRRNNFSYRMKNSFVLRKFSFDNLRKDYLYTGQMKIRRKVDRMTPHFPRILRYLEENCDEGGSQTGRNRSQGSVWERSFPHNESDSARRSTRLSLEEMSKHILFANLINTEKKFLDPYCRYDTRGSSETNNFTIVREPCITR